MYLSTMNRENANNSFLFVILILSGLFVIVAAVLNWDWYFNDRKTLFWVNLIGRPATRVLHIILGIVLIVCGILGMVKGQ